MIRDDFCAVILTHGRPDRVVTIETLRRGGYTGRILLVVDDEDEALNEYQSRYGDDVLVFSKGEMEGTFDEGDNLANRRGVVYARNACPALVKSAGYRYFIELDDDYTDFCLRVTSAASYGYVRHRVGLDSLFNALTDFLIETPAHTVALSQGGDWIGGGGNLSGGIRMRRKAMNSFVCDVEDPVTFLGRINEDTTTYTYRGRQGVLYFTVMQAMLTQITTQANPGGMTGLYLDHGTYVKSFYSVLWSPSCAKVSAMGDPRSGHMRFHHDIAWRHTVPMILRESVRKEK